MPAVHAPSAGPGAGWVSVPSLLGNPALARWVEEQLRNEHGWSVTANPRTARVRVRGNGGTPPEEAVAAAIQGYGPLRQLRRAPPRTRRAGHALRSARLVAEPRQTPPKARAPSRDAALHSLRWTHVQQHTRSGPAGLSAQEAARRLKQGGRNELSDIIGRSSADILIGQVTALPSVLLAAAAGLAWMTRARGESAAIGGVMVLNALLGFGTEWHAERTVDSLRRLAPGRARVLRDGAVIELPAAQVVVGDVLLLEPGDRVVADARVFDAHRLSANEAPLTGESLPVRKQPEDRLPRATALGERSNMVYLGTVISGGTGRALVVATAADSMLGAIRDLAQGAKAPRTRLQEELDHIGAAVALAAGAVCVGMFLLGLMRGRPMWPLVRSAVSLGVAAIPEGLATVATSLMASGIQRLRRQRIYTRSLDVLENLGGVDVVCFDKTGTLTLNQMSVGVLSAGRQRLEASQGRWGDSVLRKVPRECAQVLALCNEAGGNGLSARDATAYDGNGEVQAGSGNGHPNGNGQAVQGSSTERALLEFAERRGVDVLALRSRWPMRQIKQRSEHHPYMVTLHAGPDGAHLVAAKGSPQAVLERCTHWHDGHSVVPLGAQARADILGENEALAARGFRVLGIATRRQRRSTLDKTGKLTWLGLVGMSDPLREDMRKTLGRFRAAGIRPIVITGDQPGTTRAVIETVGLQNAGKVLDGASLPEDATALAPLLDNVIGVARASPALKLEVVRALQQRGHVVAMIGDGINDGPALRAANVGVAMGASGTDFAQAMSDLVLEVDHPAHLLEAVSAGRTAHRNVRKSVQYLLSTNLSEVLLVAGTAALGTPDPLSPMALLWTNLATDIAPAIALGLEPAEHDVLSRGPIGTQRRLLQRSDFRRNLSEGGLIASAALAAFAYGWVRHGAGPSAQAVTFSTLNLAQLLHAWSVRNDLPIGARARTSNRLLDASLLATLALTAGAVTLPPLRRLIGAGPIDALDAAVAMAAGSLPLTLRELGKRRASVRTATQ